MVIQVTLLAENWLQSTKSDALSAINRQLAIHLTHHRNVKVGLLIPKCSPEDKQDAEKYRIKVFEPGEHPGLDPVYWLGFPPEGFSTDVVIGHDVKLGWQGKAVRQACGCKWIHVVHSNAEEVGVCKNTSGAISQGQDKHQIEVKLCVHADMAVAVGPKLKESFSSSLRYSGREMITLTPGIFNEFRNIPQEFQESKTFSLLIFGRGDDEDFELKGFDVAAEAVANLKDSNYRLVVVGAPDGRQEELAGKLQKHGVPLKQLAVRHFLKNRIEQTTHLFSEVDLLLMPSATEGFGLPALEALSAGLPFLASSNSGFAEALKDVPLGSQCVVEPEEDWSKAIEKVYKNYKTRQKETKMLRDEYDKKYPWKEQCALLVKAMQTMCPDATKKATVKKTQVEVSPSNTEEKKSEGAPQKTGAKKKKSEQNTNDSEEKTEGAAKKAGIKKKKTEVNGSDQKENKAASAPAQKTGTKRKKSEEKSEEKTEGSTKKAATKKKQIEVNASGQEENKAEGAPAQKTGTKRKKSGEKSEEKTEGTTKKAATKKKQIEVNASDQEENKAEGAPAQKTGAKRKKSDENASNSGEKTKGTPKKTASAKTKKSEAISSNPEEKTEAATKKAVAKKEKPEMNPNNQDVTESTPT